MKREKRTGGRPRGGGREGGGKKHKTIIKTESSLVEAKKHLQRVLGFGMSGELCQPRALSTSRRHKPFR